MSKTANELLQGILTTVVKIEGKMSKEEKTGIGAGTSGIKSMLTMSGSLAVFGKIKPETKRSFISFMKDISEIVRKDKGKNFEYFANGIVKVSSSLPDLIKNLNELGRMRTSRVDSAISTLKHLYDFMHEMGDARSARRVERAINLFENMGKSLERISKPLRSISTFLMYLAVGIVAFAAALLLTANILKLGKPSDAILFIGFTIGTLVLMFGILAVANRVVGKGVSTIKDMGVGMLALSLGIVSFALAIKIIPDILGNETGGSITKSIFLMMGIVAASVLMFSMIGVLGGVIKKGTEVVFMMSLGLVALSGTFVLMATAAKYLQGGSLTLGNQKAEAEEKDANKKMILRGLGTFGLILLASTAAFTLLGIPYVSELVLLGVATAIGMALGLILLATAVSKLSKTARELEGQNVGDQIAFLVGGTIEGMIEGLGALTGGKKGISGVASFLKNSALIFAGTGVLMAMSLSLSMFAKAISAFAELENLRIIEGYDEKGRPIFGEKVNVSKVADNISYSISTFLDALLESTDGLTRDKATAIRKMGRALTGKRGILSAVIQFSDALKVYSQFGEKNEIGYLTYDEKGNEITKYVKATQVVDNMIGSFLYFTEKLFNKSEEEFGDGEESGISGRQKRRMKRMSKALVGRNGILGAVMQFSDVLKVFAEFGANNELPIMDAEGKPTGKTLKIDQIANNIVKALTTFSDTLADKLEKGQVKDASKALAKYDNLIERLNKLSTSMDGLTKMTNTISDLAEGIGALAINLDKLNTDKLESILQKTNSAAARQYIITGNEERSSGTATTTTPSQTIVGGGAYAKPENWDKISQMIGEQVGARVSAALRNGQFVFEFDTSKTGGIYYWQPK